MFQKIERGRPASIGDEIGVLAQRYLMDPDSRGLQRIDEHIQAAMAESRWDDMSKWHRVRLRLIRMQQQLAAGERLGLGAG
ncbi:hypothetical protein [Sphingomonas soli]|uniref:hypothetical protein n=1 Tax=Sphingomonas soli TaxID=266127 RepID=UPI0008322617|nr:hypothetical protein [Sphingomonas soli]